MSTKKFLSPGATGNWNNENQKIWLRLPVAYLSLAEAYCEKGDLDNAKVYLNRLRTRVQASIIISTDQDELLQIIRDEWDRELHMEFVEVFNIQRWRTREEHYYNNAWYESLDPPFSDHMYLNLIPGSQLSAHPGLVDDQNPDW